MHLQYWYRNRSDSGAVIWDLIKDNIIGIKLTEQLNQKKEVLKDLLQKEPAIRQISFSQYYPGKTISQWGSELDMNGEKKDLSFDTFCADADFFKILGLKLVSGRFYSNDLSTDNRKAVVNETFLREHNIKIRLEVRSQAEIVVMK